MFEINQYTKSNVWKGNKYLVQPDGVKVCESCGEPLYSCEFADYLDFPDGKLPSCSKCCRKHKKEKAFSFVDSSGIRIECKKCKEDKPLSSFVQRAGDWTEIGDQCYECRNEFFLNKVG